MFDFYSDGRTSVDNMIVVVSNKYSNPNNEISSQCVEAFYYYGEGKYGYEPTLEEADEDVFTSGEFPVFNLRAKAEKEQIYFGETTTITPNRTSAVAVFEKTDVADIKQDPETGVVTVKAGDIQGYVSVKFEYQYDETSLLKTVTCNVWVQNPKKYSTLDEANIQGDTIKTYFYMPDDWRNENSLCYDETIGLESCHPSIYWWTINSEGKVEYNSGGTYVVTETVADNVYLAKIPANTYGLMWLNSMPSDYFSNGTHEITYDDIGKEYDDYGYYYPNGLESFDNMVTIPFYYQDNNFDQINGYVSRPFYYYGDGKYGYEPTLEQAGEDVFSDGEIPVFNLRAKAEKNIVKTGETITITPSRAKAIATIDNTDVATIQQNPETGVVTLTGVSEGTAKVNFSYQFSEYTPVFEASVEIKVENEYIVDKVKLSKTSFTYNGKKKTPSVTAIDTEGRTLKKGTDYIVTYSKGCKNVGKYTAKVVFKGKYKGTKILNFKIVPKSTKIKEIKGAKKSLTVKWTKIKTQADGYQLQYSTNAKFKSAGKKTVKNITKTTISKLKSNKKYFVRIRTYKTVKGKKYYSQWSKTVSRKTK